MTNALTIEADWETLERGPPEERACFSALGIRYGDVWLTRAEDTRVNRVRDKVHVSAYQLAEWLAWNWWRLRWEPRTRTLGWSLSHRLSTIGGGYVWPNITIFSDGERVVLLAKPTQANLREPLRYIADFAAVVRASALEAALDLYIDQVRGQMRAEGVGETNLDQVWQDVSAERRDPDASSRRRFEALLGFDPDEAQPDVIEGLLADGAVLGEPAMNEIAAGHAQGGTLWRAATLEAVAEEKGFDFAPCDAVRLANDVHLPPAGQVAAWRRGAEAARALRQQEQLGAAPISNDRLAQMAGVAAGVLNNRTAVPDLSFALQKTATSGRAALRSKWEAGRRFELARLLGEQIAGASGGRLFPATRSYTYRQKMQRSFAAEFLSPFGAVEDMLGGDYSDEQQEDVADHFIVSALTIRTLLVNHGRLDRDNVEEELEAVSDRLRTVSN